MGIPASNLNEACLLMITDPSGNLPSRAKFQAGKFPDTLTLCAISLSFFPPVFQSITCCEVRGYMGDTD